MSDQNTQVEQVAPEQAPKEYSAIELKAIDQGWIPKEEFDGDEDSFIDAAEFVRRGELFSKIEKQSKEVKVLRQALEAFKEHHTKVKQAEYDRALKSLKDARKQAVLDGEHERAFALEEKMEEIVAEKETVSKEAAKTIPEPEDDVYTEEFSQWVTRNEWYESNETMRATADALGLKLHNQGLSPSEVLRKVENLIRKEFPHKFKPERANREQAVEATTRGGPSKKASEALTPVEREIMQKIVKTGVMTEAEYIKELMATR
jgi:hypothetical protein